MSSRLSCSASEPVFVLTGASGWFGRTALWEFEEMFGPEALRSQVLAFASSTKSIDFGSPHGPMQALPLSQLDQVDRPRGLLHLAFLTRERVVAEGLDAYIQQNLAITSAIAALLERHPAIPIITTSSGAAASLDGRPADLAGDPYATLKQEEELLWKCSSAHRMAVVFRVYAASGRFLKNPSLFALGDFIRQAQTGQPITVKSPRPVIRSYVHVGTLMRLAWLMLNQPLPTGYRRIDAVDRTISLVDLAACVARLWGLPPPQSRIDINLSPDHYAGDSTAFSQLMERFGIQTPSLEDQIRETSSSQFF
jgi:nucleoside-diphosphate-sugar epimerase